MPTCRRSRILPLLLLLPLAGCSADYRRTAWSPDSRSVATDVDGRLRVLDVPSGQFTTYDRDGAQILNPTYSPNGRLLACYAVTPREGTSPQVDLRLLHLQSRRECRQVADVLAPGKESDPEHTIKLLCSLSWSPDSRQLAYVRTRALSSGPASEATELAVMVEIIDLATRRTTSLARPGEDQFLPAWSPDGRCIAYMAAPRSRNGEGHGPDLDLCVEQVPGSARRTWPAESVGLLWPFGPVAWTPDSAGLAVLRGRPGQSGLAAETLPLRGGAPTRLALLETGYGSLAPDLKALVYLGGPENADLVYRSAPFTAPQVLDRLPRYERKAGGAGQGWTETIPTLSPNGRQVALILRDPTTSRKELRLYDVRTRARQVHPLQDARRVRPRLVDPSDPVFAPRSASQSAGGALPGFNFFTCLLLGAALPALGVAARLVLRALAQRLDRRP